MFLITVFLDQETVCVSHAYERIEDAVAWRDSLGQLLLQKKWREHLGYCVEYDSKHVVRGLRVVKSLYFKNGLKEICLKIEEPEVPTSSPLEALIKIIDCLTSAT